VIDKEQPKKQRKALDWNAYWTYDEVNQWMDALVAQNPSSVSLINYGRSFEDRNLRGVKINIGGGDKKTVVFEGTMHAREWISTATTTWMANELLTSNDPEVQDIARSYEWHIFPVTNPDGYGESGQSSACFSTQFSSTFASIHMEQRSHVEKDSSTIELVVLRR
jgi:murein tripeptide amidase MpaA